MLEKHIYDYFLIRTHLSADSIMAQDKLMAISRYKNQSEVKEIASNVLTQDRVRIRKFHKGVAECGLWAWQIPTVFDIEKTEKGIKIFYHLNLERNKEAYKEIVGGISDKARQEVRQRKEEKVKKDREFKEWIEKLNREKH